MASLRHIEFAYWWALLLIPFLIAGWYFIYKLEKKNPVKLRYSYLSKGNEYSNWKTKYYFVPEILKLLSLIALIIGLARPRVPAINESVKGKGIDIVIALDLSLSMLTQDFTPNRLETSKKLSIEFVNNRISDRIGLVVFSGESFTQCPLTVDHEILKQFISQQQAGYLADGTAIGMGLATAVNRMKESKANSRVVILMTDGVNNSGYINPLEAGNIAAQLGIKVYCIGIGSDEYALGPVGINMSGNVVMNYTKSEIDEKLLTDIAEKTGGKYFRAKNENEFQRIYKNIDSLEKSEIETAVLKKYDEWYRIPVALSLICLLISFLLSNTIFRRYGSHD
ncbi:MAG: hypothetical protein RLZZ546_3374 [Bacteroidota bacterium]